MSAIVTSTFSRRELRKQDRRQAIVDAARESFLTRGYAGTSMSGLVKTLGGSKTTLWTYFRTKEELFAAVIEDVTASFRTVLDDEITDVETLEAGLTRFCSGFLHKLGSSDGLATWRLVVAESGRFPEIGRIFNARAVQQTRASLAMFLDRHVASRALLSEDTGEMAELMIDLCVLRQTRLAWDDARPASVAAAAGVPALPIVRLFLRIYGNGGDQRPDERGALIDS